MLSIVFPTLATTDAATTLQTAYTPPVEYDRLIAAIFQPGTCVPPDETGTTSH
tara:strand:+ start:614 stop:772 length:159 start_codon:yes stop_codon:yes gene_type:complete